MNDVVLVPHVFLTLYKTAAMGRYMGNGGNKTQYYSRLRCPLNNAFTYRDNFEDRVQRGWCLLATFVVVIYRLVLVRERND